MQNNWTDIYCITLSCYFFSFFSQTNTINLHRIRIRNRIPKSGGGPWSKAGQNRTRISHRCRWIDGFFLCVHAFHAIYGQLQTLQKKVVKKSASTKSSIEWKTVLHVVHHVTRWCWWFSCFSAPRPCVTFSLLISKFSRTFVRLWPNGAAEVFLFSFFHPVFSE